MTEYVHWEDLNKPGKENHTAEIERRIPMSWQQQVKWDRYYETRKSSERATERVELGIRIIDHIKNEVFLRE